MIRKHGLKHRMPKPEELIREMNRLSIEMTQTARKKKDSKRERKRVLRQMKEHMQVIRRHANGIGSCLERWGHDLSWDRPAWFCSVWSGFVFFCRGRSAGEEYRRQEVECAEALSLRAISHMSGKASVAVEFGNIALGETEGYVDWDFSGAVRMRFS